jgi:hypothetical protein
MRELPAVRRESSVDDGMSAILDSVAADPSEFDPVRAANHYQSAAGVRSAALPA